MGKVFKTAHISLTAAAWGIFAVSLIRTAAVLKTLSDEIGVHFASDGSFDVFASKRYIAYPYIITLLALLFCETIAHFSPKMRLGLKVSEAGARKIISALKLQTDAAKLCVSFFFAGVWADCVIRQRPLDTSFAVFTLIAIFLSIILFAAFALAVRITDSKRKK